MGYVLLSPFYQLRHRQVHSLDQSHTDEKGQSQDLDPRSLAPGCFLRRYYYDASQLGDVKQPPALLTLRLPGGADFVMTVLPGARYANTSSRFIGTTLGRKDPISNHELGSV